MYGEGLLPADMWTEQPVHMIRVEIVRDDDEDDDDADDDGDGDGGGDDDDDGNYSC